jgi:hypothetical protein
VAVAEQLGDDGGADQAGAAGNEDAHGTLLVVMGRLSRHRTSVNFWSPARRRSAGYRPRG